MTYIDPRNNANYTLPKIDVDWWKDQNRCIVCGAKNEKRWQLCSQCAAQSRDVIRIKKVIP